VLINIVEDPLPDHVTILKTVLGLISTPCLLNLTSWYIVFIIGADH
jgi:hypothetical protein